MSGEPQSVVDVRAERELAADLRRNAASIGAMIAPLERSCFEAGGRLSDAMPGLNGLKALFETLTTALEGEAIGGAIDDLTEIAHELADAAEEVTEESRALVELAEVNQSIGAQTSSLLVLMRTIGSLVFSMKIEAAPLKELADDLTAFAQGVQELSERGRRELEDYDATHGKLAALLHSSCDAQAQFRQGHQARLRTIAAEIVDSLKAVADLRARTLAALQEVGPLSQEVSERIGRCIIAFQVGDSTRQRVEHVQDALGLVADRLEGDRGGRLASDDPEKLASRVCRLQALQLDAAREEFIGGMESAAASLVELTQKNDALERQGVELLGAADLDDNSLLEEVERKLAAARSIIVECRRARGFVDQAVKSAAATVTDLQQRTNGLSEIVDVSIIGTNALLRSTRLGDRGRGFSFIAQELRACSVQIVAGINELPPRLKRVSEQAGRVGEVGRRLDAERLAALDARMSVAMGAIDSRAEQMTAALEKLKQEAGSIRGALDAVAAQLASRGDIASVLANGAAALGAVAGRLGGAEGRSPAIDRLLDDALRPAYSMAGERSVHDAYTGYRDEEAQSGMLKAVGSDLDAILF